MNIFPRPSTRSLSAVALVCCIALAPHLIGQDRPLDAAGNPLLGAADQHVTILSNDPAMLNHSQGYLGVGLRDIDTGRAAQLKLKEARGAEIVTIDHDAPAAKAGLRVHDVVLGLNNQPIDGEAQLSHLLRATPPGRMVTLLISRDGQQQTLTVQLADRSTIEASAWSQHIPVPQPDDDQPDPASAGPSFGSGFISPLGTNPLYTGLNLDMLGPQLANYFGVHDGSGLLVRRVDDNSPGSAAGLRAGDVIVKVNGQVIATTNQWFHVIHANRGKQIQLTVIRDKHEGNVNMMAGRGKHQGSLEEPGMPGTALTRLLAFDVPEPQEMY
jgi:predicted metalloprotease with PDZ domain